MAKPPTKRSALPGILAGLLADPATVAELVAALAADAPARRALVMALANRPASAIRAVALAPLAADPAPGVSRMVAVALADNARRLAAGPPPAGPPVLQREQGRPLLNNADQ